MRRLLGFLLPLVVVAACGDDGEAARPTTTAPDRDAELGEAAPSEDDARGPADADGGGDGPAADEAPDATVPTDTPAEDGPEDAGEEEGLGDALLVADLRPDTLAAPGPAGASGRFEAELVEGVLCADADAGGLDGAVTGAHLHEGAPGASGAVVADLGEPDDAGTAAARWRDACTDVEDAVIERLAAAPGAHHVDVHTVGHPEGAVAGPLSVASIFDRTIG